jgi:hypothetical protein
MSRHLFVWSMARGPRAGAPCEHTPGPSNASGIPRESGHREQGPLHETRALAYVVDELSHRRLRWGWGVANPAVDGRWHAPSGGEPDRLTGQPAGSLDPESAPAGEDRHVGCGLLEMAAGDVVFLPKSPDDGHFMVATVTRPDACEHVTVVDEADVRHGFRHVIGVEETMRYAYGAGTLYPDMFEAPRRQAIQRIAEDDPAYRPLTAFLRSWGR